MSFEVYIINLIIGAITFFILQFTLKKFVKEDHRRNRLTWIGTIVLTPIIYVALIGLLLTTMFHQPSSDFNRNKWLSDKSARHEMRDDLVESEILKNKTKEEVLEILGPPDVRADTLNYWDYDLGISAAGFGWQFNNLIITFDKNRVAKVEKREVVD